MRKAAALLVTTTMVAGLALVAAGPAGASVSAKTSKFCKAVKKTNYGDLGNPTSEKDAAKTEKQLTRLAKSASGKTKEAVETLRDAYGEIADGESAKDVFADGDVIVALGTFGLAVGKCALSDLPDITLPDIDLPDITLPEL
jgi:hypothetical protein